VLAQSVLYVPTMLSIALVAVLETAGVATLPATELTSSGALLNGAPMQTGIGWFRYSTESPANCDDAFGTRAPSQDGIVLRRGPYAVRLVNLLPNVEYFFCAISQNAEGTSFGEVKSFVTLPLAPSATTGAATQITATTVKLAGSARANGGATRAWFRIDNTNPGVCTDTFGKPSAVATIAADASPVPLVAALTGLRPAFTYYYCAIASSPGGDAYGTVESFTTAEASPLSASSAAALTPDLEQAAALHSTLERELGKAREAQSSAGWLIGPAIGAGAGAWLLVFGWTAFMTQWCLSFSGECHSDPGVINASWGLLEVGTAMIGSAALWIVVTWLTREPARLRVNGLEAALEVVDAGGDHLRERASRAMRPNYLAPAALAIAGLGGLIAGSVLVFDRDLHAFGVVATPIAGCVLGMSLALFFPRLRQERFAAELLGL
jgi:hypothetical protein